MTNRPPNNCVKPKKYLVEVQFRRIVKSESHRVIRRTTEIIEESLIENERFRAATKMASRQKITKFAETINKFQGFHQKV